ncbi:BspA family leucine-rich repeat surface protein [Chloroherpeton thalassium]|nr:BspA family leucine-rich repeat surface protein [Chloroherpeton thalassium]
MKITLPTKLKGIVFLLGLLWLNTSTVFAQPMEFIFNITSVPATVELPLYGSVDVNVVWGDGDSDSYMAPGDKSHEYTTTGQKTVTISGTLTQFGKGSNGSWAGVEYLAQVNSFGSLTGFTSISGAFNNADNLTSVPTVLPSTVNNLNYTFMNIDQASITNLESWDVSAVLDMQSMFSGAASFNQNISGWNVSGAMNMVEMFYNATAFDQNIGGWNISAVEEMDDMFYGATLSTANYDALLIGWAAQTVQSEVIFHGGNSQYSTGAAATARQSLIDDYYWGITDGGQIDAPLPVSLSSFSGTSIESGVRLNWQTASEAGNAGFLLYRNGEEIASYQNTDALKGQGTTSSETNYSFTDSDVNLWETYTYKLTSIDNSGDIHEYSESVSVTITEDYVSDTKATAYTLEQNYPNPFNPSTTINFSLKQAGKVAFQVFDILGRVVYKEILNGNAGENTPITFEGKNLNSGVYFYRISANGYSETKKMMLLK